MRCCERHKSGDVCDKSGDDGDKSEDVETSLEKFDKPGEVVTILKMS